MMNLLAGGLGAAGNADGIGAAARFTTPASVASDGAGNLYIADTSNHTIRKMVLATGVVTTIAGMVNKQGSQDGVGLAAQFSFPEGVACDGAGNLFVADTSNDTIRKIVLSSGTVTTLAGTAGMTGSTDGTGTAARFMSPHGLAADGAGNLYVVDSGNDTIRKIVIASGAVTTIAGMAGMTGSISRRV